MLGLLAVGVPALAALGSYVYATRGAVLEAEQERRHREVETNLERGFFGLGEGGSREPRAAFTEALRLDPSSLEAQAGMDLLDREDRPASGTVPAAAASDPALAAFLAGTRALDAVHGGRRSVRYEALEHFERAIRLSRHARALYYFEAMHAAIHTEDKKTIGRFRDALLHLWPGSLMTRFYASSTLRYEGKLEEAARELEALAREHPEVSVIWIALGTTLGSLDREAEAAAALRKALAITPDSPAALRGLGRSLLALGDALGAVKELRQAARLSPREPYVKANLAEALFAAGDAEAGVAEYRESLRLSPDDAWKIRHGLAARLAKVGRMSEAVEESRKVVAERPSYAEGWMHLGLLLSRIDQNAEALEMFRKGLELEPDDADGLLNVAEVASRLGRFAEARVAAEKALTLEPGRARAQFLLGRALEGLDDLAGSVACYEMATRLDPGYAEAWCSLGLRLRDLRRFEEALPRLRRGHELAATRPTWRNPSAQWVADCERLIATGKAVDAVLRGESRPARLADWVAFARFCQNERGPADEAALLAKAMAEAEPEIVSKLRLQAVRSALRASGLGSASSRPASRPKPASASRPDRAASGRRALALLGEELSSIEASVAEGDRSATDARQAVGRWLGDPDLRILRDSAGEGLAETDAAGWRALRARVDAFLAGK